MKIAFLTEMRFEGKVPSNHSNMRTEFAWMHTLSADHKHIFRFNEVEGYDHVFVIFPKGQVFLSAEGTKIGEGRNPVSELLSIDIISKLKLKNKFVHYVQEGPHWWFNDYEIVDQVYFYNLLAQCDSIFAHNESDTYYYRGLFPNKPVRVLPSLMIEESIKDITPAKQEKAIIGGNFARWYGGFESYMVADNFDVEIWAQTSHAMRIGEDSVDGLKHLPRLMWTDWMKALSEFKYAVHLMPTVAAGTFSLNCAYFGIPCIGNKQVDTQRICHPELSVDVHDIEKARELAIKLKTDTDFYNSCSEAAKQLYREYYSKEVWIEKLNKILA